jgi:hypothetical protein
MKNIIIATFLFFTVALSAEETPKTMIVEASCGQCQFGMKGYACDLAVRLMENRIL